MYIAHNHYFNFHIILCVLDFVGQDLVTVVACLTQILLHDYRRTIEGFQALVQKEWVAMGHRFTQQYGLWNKNDEQVRFIGVFGPNSSGLRCIWMQNKGAK